MPFSRRNFLKAAGVAAAGAAGAVAGRKLPTSPGAAEADPWPDKEERWVASVCPLCPGGCGVRARVIDGRVAKIEGNPFHPVNQGRLCPLGQAAPQLLYHPDRIRAPLVREAGGTLRPAPWEEAISLLAGKLKTLRAGGQAHSAVLLAGSFRGLRERFLRRFMTAFGSPNYIRAAGAGPEEPDPAHALTQGVDRPLAPDLFHARSILSFGAPLLEGGPSPVHQMRAYGHFRQGKGRRRGVLIQVEPRRSATAERADKWVTIRPGTETTLALGIAHALILENLFDENFVNRYCEDFYDRPSPAGRTLPGFRSIALRKFTLPRVSRTTGVPVETILQIARAFARNQPGIAIAPSGSEDGSAPLGMRLAVHYLNALVGNLGRSGGWRLQGKLPLGEWEEPKKDARTRKGLARARIDGAGADIYALASDASETLPERIRSGKPYPVRALLVAGTDPLFDHPRAAEFAEAVGRVPLVVAFSSLPGPLVQKAHIVLPEANFLERWTEDTLTHIGGFSVFSVGRPAVRDKEAPPALEDIFLRVAKKIGGPVAESFGWDAFTDAIFEAAVPLAEAGRGYVVSDPVHERFRTILSRQGYWQKEVEDADELWEKLLVNGAWWDPGDEEGGAEAQILHRGRKFQFFPERLKQILSSLDSRSRRRAVRSLGLMDGEGPPFPADPPRPKEKPGELELVLFRPLALFGPAAAELPWLQEQLGPHVGARWDSWVEIHPREAERLGLHPGDRVELSAGGKKLRTRVRTFEGVPPGTAAMPLGLGRGEAGRWAKDRGADPRRILRIEADPIGGTGFLPPARVRIRRVG